MHCTLLGRLYPYQGTRRSSATNPFTPVYANGHVKTWAGELAGLGLGLLPGVKTRNAFVFIAGIPVTTPKS